MSQALVDYGACVQYGYVLVTWPVCYFVILVCGFWQSLAVAVLVNTAD